MLVTVLTVSCNNERHNTVTTAKELSKSMARATENTIAFEGKFVRLERINSRDYYLYLKSDKDSIVEFVTMMPIGDDEIRLLKKSGNNIQLRYTNYYNPVKKVTEKMVQMMVPVYELEK
jgi:hypothetical protein